MTEIYERDLYGMKYSILKSPYHKKVVTVCSEKLGVPPMKLRRRLIENLDMMMLESLGARYDSWMEHGDKEGGVRHEIGYELFTTYIPIVSREIMDKAMLSWDGSGDESEKVKENLKNMVFGEDES